MAFSAQHMLAKIRPARVRITYDVEIGNALVKKELPYVFGIIADLTGQTKKKPFKLRKFVKLQTANFNDVMVALNPVLQLNINNVITGKGKLSLDLKFHAMDDFGPIRLTENIPLLKGLLDQRKALNDLLGRINGSDVLYEYVNEIITKCKPKDLENAAKKGKTAKLAELTVEELISKGKLVTDPSNEKHALHLLQTLGVVLEKYKGQKHNCTVTLLNKALGDIDALVSLQLDEILHDPEFQKLESAWRGLHFFLSSANFGSNVEIRLLDASKEELLKDLRGSIGFDQSQFFKKVYEDEYGTFGGTPYSCLVGDFAFSCGYDDMDLLRRIAEVACAAHAPFVSAADPAMFGMDSFGDMSVPVDMKQVFESSGLEAWKGFRQDENSRYVSLAVPRVMARIPYGAQNPVKGLNYNEIVTGDNNHDFCWMNASYALAQRMCDAATLFNWVTAIRGVHGGGMVHGLPIYSYQCLDGDKVTKCPTEVTITDRREKELSDLGFVPLCHCKGANYAVFFGSQTAVEPKEYTSEDATANAYISSKLPNIMAASRFAHYIKAIMRDTIGRSATREEIEGSLNSWLSDYIVLNPGADHLVKAEYPLSEGQVIVEEDPEKPGCYKAIIYLKPHFQLEELSASIRLVARLPQGG